jgi:N-acetylglucosaminyl-diphospho-decaprenol L-rhamnosyltransferase
MSAAATPELSIVIVNWNSGQYLRACLQSIIDQASELAYEVVVVDNASTRDDLDKLAADFPFIRLIKNRSNIGFARANNIGFQNTCAASVLFLNPDTYITGPALQLMLDVLTRQRDAGIVGCRLLNSDHSVQTSCVLRYPRLLNQALGADALHSRFTRLPLWGLAALSEQTSKPVSVEAVSGACLMIRREIFERVGLFSQEYFMYTEDVDLCYKVARAGWRCYHVGGAVVIHHGGGSSRLRPTNTWAAVIQCGAKLQFIRTTRGVTYGYLYRLVMAASAVVRLLVLTGASVAPKDHNRHQRVRAAIAKWVAIFCWSLRPVSSVQKLITTQQE